MIYYCNVNFDRLYGRYFLSKITAYKVKYIVNRFFPKTKLSHFRDQTKDGPSHEVGVHDIANWILLFSDIMDLHIEYLSQSSSIFFFPVCFMVLIYPSWLKHDLEVPCNSQCIDKKLTTSYIKVKAIGQIVDDLSVDHSLLNWFDNDIDDI